jgi:hypothetical protein
MNKPDLKQILQDLDKGVLISPPSWRAVLEYAIELQSERQNLLRMTTPYIPGPHQVNGTLTGTGLEFLG